MTPSQPLEYVIADVFALRPYTGNQLAVFRNAGALTTEQMQTLAREMNFSESTFILSDLPREGGYDVRIFTTDIEMPFAGHPTIGTAAVIRALLPDAPQDRLTLNLGVGQIPVTFAPDGWAWMHQKPPQFDQTFDAAHIAPIFGLSPDDLDPSFVPQIVSTGMRALIIPLRTRAAIERALPDNLRFRALCAEANFDSAYLFCPEPIDPANTLHARMFFVGTFISEDPATGSACGAMAGYLAKVRYFGSSTVDARVEQGYAVHRPSLLHIRATAMEDTIDVHVGGRVFLVARGTLLAQNVSV